MDSKKRWKKNIFSSQLNIPLNERVSRITLEENNSINSWSGASGRRKSLSLSLFVAARTSQFRRPWPRVDGCCQRAKGAKGGRGRPRKEWWLGGKAISWEKGAGVTRARDSARGDASLRGAVTRALHTRIRAWTKRVEHVVTAVVGVR